MKGMKNMIKRGDAEEEKTKNYYDTVHLQRKNLNRLSKKRQEKRMSDKIKGKERGHIITENSCCHIFGNNFLSHIRTNNPLK